MGGVPCCIQIQVGHRRLLTTLTTLIQVGHQRLLTTTLNTGFCWQAVKQVHQRGCCLAVLGADRGDGRSGVVPRGRAAMPVWPGVHGMGRHGPRWLRALGPCPDGRQRAVERHVHRDGRPDVSRPVVVRVAPHATLVASQCLVVNWAGCAPAAHLQVCGVGWHEVSCMRVRTVMRLVTASVLQTCFHQCRRTLCVCFCAFGA